MLGLRLVIQLLMLAWHDFVCARQSRAGMLLVRVSHGPIRDIRPGITFSKAENVISILISRPMQALNTRVQGFGKPCTAVQSLPSASIHRPDHLQPLRPLVHVMYPICSRSERAARAGAGRG